MERITSSFDIIRGPPVSTISATSSSTCAALLCAVADISRDLMKLTFLFNDEFEKRGEWRVSKESTRREPCALANWREMFRFEQCRMNPPLPDCFI